MALMSFPVAVAALVVALAAVLLTYSLTSASGAQRSRVMTNLHRGGELGGDKVSEETQRSGLVGLSRRLTPTAWVRQVDRLLARAGRPPAWPLERILVTKLLAASGALSLMSLLLSGNPGARMLAFAITLVTLAWFLPDLLLYNTGVKRRTAIQQALPDTLDQMTIAVEAGLGFEAAMAHVARNSTGPLADELIRTLQDIQVGQPRRQAYQALADRSPEPDLRRFLRAVIQAERHGVSISRVLSTQADEMRLKRRQRAEEKAMQIPVKVVFPLILTILPVLFIIVMGPGVINAIESFSGQ